MFDVITIGTATRDVFLRSRQFKTLKDSVRLQKLGFRTGAAECVPLGSKVEVENAVHAIGGGAANAAVTFGRMGMRTAALVKVGEDSSGRDVREVLKQEHITVLSRKSARERTAYSTILVTPQGERTILVYRGVSDDFEAADIPRTMRAHWIYIAPGEIPFALLSKIMRAMKQQGTRIAMNPSRFYLILGMKRLKPLLRLLDVVIVNREEASFLTGVRYGDVHGIFRKFDTFVPGIAVMTDGARGAAVSDGKQVYRVGVFKARKVIDRTGAGDAFGSGFVVGLMLKKGDIEEALRIASANATSVVEHVGAQAGILRRSELRDARWRKLAVRRKRLTP